MKTDYGSVPLRPVISKTTDLDYVKAWVKYEKKYSSKVTVFEKKIGPESITVNFEGKHTFDTIGNDQEGGQGEGNQFGIKIVFKQIMFESNLYQVQHKTTLADLANSVLHEIKDALDNKEITIGVFNKLNYRVETDLRETLMKPDKPIADQVQSLDLKYGFINNVLPINLVPKEHQDILFFESLLIRKQLSHPNLPLEYFRSPGYYMHSEDGEIPCTVTFVNKTLTYISLGEFGRPYSYIPADDSTLPKIEYVDSHKPYVLMRFLLDQPKPPLKLLPTDAYHLLTSIKRSKLAFRLPTIKKSKQLILKSIVELMRGNFQIPLNFKSYSVAFEESSNQDKKGVVEFDEANGKLVVTKNAQAGMMDYLSYNAGAGEVKTYDFSGIYYIYPFQAYCLLGVRRINSSGPATVTNYKLFFEGNKAEIFATDMQKFLIGTHMKWFTGTPEQEDSPFLYYFQAKVNNYLRDQVLVVNLSPSSRHSEVVPSVGDGKTISVIKQVSLVKDIQKVAKLN